MAALDTNMLVRFLVQDDAVQGHAAARLMEAGVLAGKPLFVPVTVMLELEWVLRSAFGFGKVALLQTLHGLVASSDLDIESETAIEVALVDYEQASADFSDCLHAALAAAAGRAPMWTFDKAASKLDGARLLTAA